MSAPATHADLIDARLPQTQCGQCGYIGCRPYAEAIAAGTAPINQCPPGGAELIDELATLLGVQAVPLNPAHGTPVPPQVAFIDEAACIGCALCLDACPVDAIIGARKLMHTVIAAECTGCGLCLPPCPVDCIVLKPTGAPRDRALQRAAAGRLKTRYQAHLQRSAARRKPGISGNEDDASADTARKREIIARVMVRARQRLAAKEG